MTDEDLLDLTYRAAAAPAEWQRLTAELSQRLGGSAAVLYDRSIPGQNRPLHVSTVIGYDAAAQDAMRRHYSHIDIRVQRAKSAVAGHVYFDDRDVPFADIEVTEIDNDFYRPNGVGHIGAVVLARGIQQFTILSVHRSRSLGAFRSEERSLLDRLAPHLVRAWRVTSRLQEEAEMARALESALDVVRAKVFVLGADGAVRRMSVDAEELVRNGNRLRLVKRRLFARDRKDNEALQRLISTAVARPQIDAAPPPAVAIIRGDHPLALFAVPTRGSAEAVALLFASDPAEAAPPDPVLLRNQFGFTRAEARVVAALAEGIDAPTIASRHVVSVETVRSQIKSAQAKSGAGSQAGLALLARRSLGGLRRNFT